MTENRWKRFINRIGDVFRNFIRAVALFVKSLPDKISKLPSLFKKWSRSDDGRKGLFELLRTVIVIVLALGVAVAIIAFSSKTPLYSIQVFLTSQFSSKLNFSRMLTEAVPLIFTGVAVCLMVRCGQFNMMGEGCFFMGALFGAVLASALKVPPFLATILSLLIPAVLSGAVGYVPGKLKASLKVNELVTSLMMNFILFGICMYLFNYHFFDPDYGSLGTPTIPDDVKLPFLSAENELSSSFLIALVIALLAYLFLAKTKFGYNIRMTGDNPKFAAYSGINTRGAIVYSQVIGSALAGFGGAAFMLGNFYRFTWKALPNYGFDGFIVAIMSRNKPLVVPLIALLFGYLRAGALEMSVMTDVANEVIYIVQAVMIILVGAHAFYEWMRKRSAKLKAAKAEAQKKEAEGA